MPMWAGWAQSDADVGGVGHEPYAHAIPGWKSSGMDESFASLQPAPGCSLGQANRPSPSAYSRLSTRKAREYHSPCGWSRLMPLVW